MSDFCAGTDLKALSAFLAVPFIDLGPNAILYSVDKGDIPFRTYICTGPAA
jgi:hypothetical protein